MGLDVRRPVDGLTLDGSGQVPDRAARRGHAAFAGWCSSAHGPGRCAQDCGVTRWQPGALRHDQRSRSPLGPPRRDKPCFSLDLRCDSSRQVLLVLVVVYIVVAIHRPAPAPVKNDHCSRLSFDTRHPQDSQQCQRRRFPPIARRSRDYSLIAAMGSGRGPWVIEDEPARTGSRPSPVPPVRQASDEH
jgi:hypothetical protein